MANLIAKTVNAVPASPATEFTVTGPTHVHCFPESGSQYVGKIVVKNSDGSYADFKASRQPGKAAVTVTLDQINSSILIDANGTYAFDKSTTTVAIGIDVEA